MGGADAFHDADDVAVSVEAVGDPGAPLVTFDRKVIEDAGYSLITPVIVMNGKKFGSTEDISGGDITVGAPLLAVAPAPQPAEAGL